MRSYIPVAVTFLLFAVSPVSARQSFIPMKEGCKLEYETTDAAGKLVEITVNEIESVEKCGQDCVTVTYSSSALDEKRREKGEIISKTVTVRDDALYTDPSLFDMHGGGTVSGEVVVFPADLKPGDMLDDYVWTTKTGILSATVTVAGQNVIAVEEITVPAGTFVCAKVVGVTEINTLGFLITNTIETWFAPGIGPVRSEVYDRKGKLRRSRVLVKYSE